MSTLSSISAKITPLLPCNFDFIDEQKTLGFVDVSSSSPLPNLVFAPLPCRSALQSKRGIAHTSNRRKRETIEAIVGSCISRAVAFSGHQFRAVLKSFQNLSARKSNSFGDVRSKISEWFVHNSNDGGGGGGGSESGSHGEGKGGDGGASNNPPLMGAVLRRAQKSSIRRGRTVLLRAANQRPIYNHVTGGSGGGSRVWLWAAKGLVARALMEPAMVETMFQAMLMPFQVIFLIFTIPELGNQIAQFLMVIFVVGPLVAIVILLLIWMWWRDYEGTGN